MFDRKTCVAWITAVALALQPCLPLVAASDGADSKVTQQQRPVFYDPSFDAKKPAAVIIILRSRSLSRELTFEEMVDQGTAWFLQRRWDRAAGSYEAAAAKSGAGAKSGGRGRKAMAMYYAAQAMAFDEAWNEAGELANIANQLVPESRELTAVRLAFWLKAGNAMEAKAAEDRLKQTDLRFEGREVCDPVTATVIVVVVVATTIITVEGIQKGSISSETLEKIIVKMLTIGMAVATATATVE